MNIPALHLVRELESLGLDDLHSYQWDLDYGNPDVFNHMAEELFFLADQGVKSFGSMLWHLFGKSSVRIAKTCLKPT